MLDLLSNLLSILDSNLGSIVLPIRDGATRMYGAFESEASVENVLRTAATGVAGVEGGLAGGGGSGKGLSRLSCRLSSLACLGTDAADSRQEDRGEPGTLARRAVEGGDGNAKPLKLGKEGFLESFIDGGFLKLLKTSEK